MGLGLAQHAGAQTCLDNPGEDIATCKREQAAAEQAEKRGELQSGINYRDNALARCDPLSGSDRDDCISRVQGEGTKRGSVQSGGIYTETRTITIGQPPEAGSSSGSSR